MDQECVMRVLKAHYRSKVVQMYITAIENNRPIPKTKQQIKCEFEVNIPKNQPSSNNQLLVTIALQGAKEVLENDAKMYNVPQIETFSRLKWF